MKSNVSRKTRTRTPLSQIEIFDNAPPQHYSHVYVHVYIRKEQFHCRKKKPLKTSAPVPPDPIYINIPS